MSAPRYQLGDIVDVAIKGVWVVDARDDGTVVVRCDDNTGRWPMPPQAAITAPGDVVGDRVASVLSLLDSMECEGSIRPFVASAVRTKLGLPPRQWPPQPGDVWDDGIPFGNHVWFAQVIHGDPGSDIVMAPMERSAAAREGCTPEALLASAAELTLVYRNKKGDDA